MNSLSSRNPISEVGQENLLKFVIRQIRQGGLRDDRSELKSRGSLHKIVSSCFQVSQFFELSFAPINQIRLSPLQNLTPGQALQKILRVISCKSGNLFFEINHVSIQVDKYLSQA